MKQPQQREKTTGQMLSEAEKLKEIETERAKQRMSEAGKSASPSRQANKGVASTTTPYKGRVRDIIAKKIGFPMTGKTLKKRRRFGIQCRCRIDRHVANIVLFLVDVVTKMFLPQLEE